MRFNPYKLYTNYRKDYHFYGFYSGIICNIQKKNPEVRDVVEIQRPFLCEKSRGIFAWDAGGQERRTVMGFLIREGARLVVRLPQEVDHHRVDTDSGGPDDPERTSHGSGA